MEPPHSTAPNRFVTWIWSLTTSTMSPAPTAAFGSGGETRKCLERRHRMGRERWQRYMDECAMPAEARQAPSQPACGYRWWVETVALEKFPRSPTSGLLGALVRASADLAASVKLTRSAVPLPTRPDAAEGSAACGVDSSAVAA